MKCSYLVLHHEVPVRKGTFLIFKTKYTLTNLHIVRFSYEFGHPPQDSPLGRTFYESYAGFFGFF